MSVCLISNKVISITNNQTTDRTPHWPIPDTFAWKSWSCIEISVSFFPANINRQPSTISQEILTNPLVYLQVLGHTSVDADSLALHKVGLAVLGGDALLVAGSGQSGVPERITSDTGH